MYKCESPCAVLIFSLILISAPSRTVLIFSLLLISAHSLHTICHRCGELALVETLERTDL